jgi:hypothetical protein
MTDRDTSLLLFNMMKFEQYFSLYEIAKTLSALRVKVASSRHRYQMYWSRLLLVDEDGNELFPATEMPSELDEFLPPRRAWHRGRKELRKKLLATGDATLIEGNYWHDNYWGVCTCENCVSNGIVGRNRLGTLLMKVREEIKNDT